MRALRVIKRPDNEACRVTHPGSPAASSEAADQIRARIVTFARMGRLPARGIVRRRFVLRGFLFLIEPGRVCSGVGDYRDVCGGL